VQKADVLADARARDLPRDHQHGRGGGVGGAEPGGGVQEPGAGDDQRGADVAPGPRVAIRHEARRLLVARRDEVDARLVAERGEDAVELDAGKAEDHPDAFAVERLDECFASGLNRVSESVIPVSLRAQSAVRTASGLSGCQRAVSERR